MIENKLVTITKENTFSDIWRLLLPYQAPISRNLKYSPVTVGDVVNRITKSTGVYLILNEACLASAIVRELEWVQKYISIFVVVKSADILSAYPKINFTQVKVDPAISYNYICIKGDKDFCLFIDDGYSMADSSVADIYFGDGADNSQKFLDDVRTVLLCGNAFNDFWLNIIVKTKNIKDVFAVVKSDCYSEQLYNECKQSGIKLLVSEWLKDGALIFTGGQEILLVSYLKDRGYISVSVEKLSAVVSQLYSCIYSNQLSFAQFTKQNGAAVWQDGSIKTLDVKDTVVLERTVAFDNMGAFIEEKFDRSEVENHNIYAAQARNVEYRFTLVPPLLEGEYHYSSIYEPVLNLYKQFKGVPGFDIEGMRRDIKSISPSNEVLDFLAAFEDYKNWLFHCAEEYEYKAYYSKINAFHVFAAEAKRALVNACLNIFNQLNSASNSVKFSRFDEEIEGYKKIIAEKELLVEQGNDALGNRRRIEILQKKIDDLKNLKNKFQSGAAENSDDAKKEFVAFCKENLQGHSDTSTGKSIEKIIQTDESKINLLKAFVKKYLYSMGKYFEEISAVLEHLCNVGIPEDYKVYEKGGKRYIFIDSEEEYASTADIRQKFNLHCAARR